MSDTPTSLEIVCKPVGASGKAIVTAKGPDGIILHDKRDLSVEEVRRETAARIHERCPGIAEAEILRKLDDHAGSLGTNAEADSPAGPGSQAKRLVELVTSDDSIELFHSPDGDAFAWILIEGHRETWRVNSKGFKEWLSRLFYLEFEGVPGSAAMQDALGTIGGIAKFARPERAVHLRVAEHEGEVWLDLCDPHWRAVRVTTTGWSVVPSAEVPVRFVRRKGMQALPEPVHGGSVEELRRLVNIKDDDSWALFIGWLVGALRPRGPYGVLAISGEQGSAKSTACKLARRLIDPSVADLRRPPKSERDVFIAGGNAWISTCNNVSNLKPDISDAFCALATDGGFATRELYSNDDEAIFATRRPVILNGIESPASRSDLVDRTIGLALKTIPEDARLDEDYVYAQFELVRPRVLGALLTAVSSALRNHGKVKLARRPRMADLATWVTAAEEGLGWKSGRFVEAFLRYRAEAQAEVIEASPIGPSILRMVGSGRWTGTATELLARLNQDVAEGDRPQEWPRNGKGMSSALKRLAPNLRSIGLAVTFAERPTGREKKRLIHLEWVGTEPSAPSARPAEDPGADLADHAERPGPTQSIETDPIPAVGKELPGAELAQEGLVAEARRIFKEQLGVDLQLKVETLPGVLDPAGEEAPS